MVLDHAGVPLLGGGFIGVDVFFVVSGYLISLLLLREVGQTGRVSLSGFYARRARRILPMATVVLVTVAVSSSLLLSVSRARQVLDDVLASSLFVANVHFSRLGTDYFSQDQASSPVQHYWSLAVEEQFYLVWPLLLMLLVVLGHHRTRRTLGVVVALCAVSLVWSVVQTQHSPTAAYFSSLTRGWELGVGVALALSQHLLSGLTVQVRRVLAAAGLLAVLAAAVTYDHQTPFPGWQALVPVLGTAAVIAAGAAADGVGASRLLTGRPATWLGDRSYSLYLWHWPVLVLGAAALAHPPSALETALLLALAMLLTEVGYRLVEQPFRHGRLRLARGKLALCLWPIAVAVVVLTSTGVARQAEVAMTSRITAAERYYADLESSGSPLAETPPTIAGMVAQSVALAEADAPPPFPLVNLEGLREDLWMRDFECYADYSASRAKICPLGDTASSVTVVAYGDSHMGMWLPSLDRIGQEQGFRVVPLVKWACVGYDVPVWEIGRREPYESCTRFRDWALDQIRTLHPDAIVLADRGLPFNVAAPESEQPDVWAAGVASTLTTMKELAPEVRVIGDVFRIGSDPETCLTEADSTMASCTFEGEARTRLANRLTERAAQAVDVPYVDVEPFTCTTDGRCPVVVDRTVTYRDRDHITRTWGLRIAEELGELLDLPV